MTATGSESQVRAFTPGYRVAALLSLGLVPALVLIAALLMFATLRSGSALREAEEASYERQAQIQRVFALMQDAETGQRGFVISGQEAFLEPYVYAVRDVDAQLRLLERNLADLPAQYGRVQRLKGLVAAKLAFMTENIALRRSATLDAAAAHVATGAGKRAMDDIRATVSAMLGAESAALAERRAAARRREVQAELIAGTLLALVGLNLVAAALLMRRHNRNRDVVLQALEQQSERLSAIFESTLDAVFTLNPSGTIETINQAGERMFGYSRDELVRRDSSLLIDLAPGEGLFLHRLGQHANGGLGAAREFTGRRSDGTTFPAEVALAIMRLKDGAHVVAAVRDITERKMAERMKDEFVATVSHELRTPLTSIAGSLGLLDAGAAGELPERAKRLTYIAKTSCERLVRLVNDLLDIQKIAEGKIAFDMRPLDLRHVAERAAEAMAGFAQERQVTVRLDLPDQPLMISGDLDRLIQVLSNLLSNAVKFSPAGGTVELKATPLPGRACVSVQDQGPGVPEAFQTALFSRFAQADASSRRSAEGSGLGLAISREIAERHRGELRLAHSGPDGACFVLELPLTTLATGLAPRGGRVLLCEDDDHAAEVIGGGLALDGFELIRARTLAEAERVLADGGVDAMILDLHLPDGNGLSLLARLRKDPARRKLPVVVVTGDVSAGLSSLAVADWITKPVDLGRLSDAVAGAIAGRSELDILHVDDDADLAEVVRASLSGAGQVRTAETLAKARRAVRLRRPDLIILDVGLPDGSGLDLLAEINGDGPQTPVIVYSGQEIDADMVGQVQAVLTKSRVSFDALAETVRALTAGVRN